MVSGIDTLCVGISVVRNDWVGLNISPNLCPDLSVICLFPGPKAQGATINANTVQQYIRGFCAANIIGWRDDITSADRILAFSVDNDLGFRVLRVRVSPNSGDWSSNQAAIDAAKSHGAMVIA